MADFLPNLKVKAKTLFSAELLWLACDAAMLLTTCFF